MSNEFNFGDEEQPTLQLDDTTMNGEESEFGVEGGLAVDETGDVSSSSEEEPMETTDKNLIQEDSDTENQVTINVPSVTHTTKVTKPIVNSENAERVLGALYGSVAGATIEARWDLFGRLFRIKPNALDALQKNLKFTYALKSDPVDTNLILNDENGNKRTVDEAKKRLFLETTASKDNVPLYQAKLGSANLSLENAKEAYEHLYNPSVRYSRKVTSDVLTSGFNYDSLDGITNPFLNSSACVEFVPLKSSISGTQKISFVHLKIQDLNYLSTVEFLDEICAKLAKSTVTNQYRLAQFRISGLELSKTSSEFTNSVLAGIRKSLPKTITANKSASDLEPYIFQRPAVLIEYESQASNSVKRTFHLLTPHQIEYINHKLTIRPILATSETIKKEDYGLLNELDNFSDVSFQQIMAAICMNRFHPKHAQSTQCMILSDYLIIHNPWMLCASAKSSEVTAHFDMKLNYSSSKPNDEKPSEKDIFVWKNHLWMQPIHSFYRFIDNPVYFQSSAFAPLNCGSALELVISRLYSKFEDGITCVCSPFDSNVVKFAAENEEMLVKYDEFKVAETESSKQASAAEKKRKAPETPATENENGQKQKRKYVFSEEGKRKREEARKARLAQESESKKTEQKKPQPSANSNSVSESKVIEKKTAVASAPAPVSVTKPTEKVVAVQRKVTIQTNKEDSSDDEPSSGEEESEDEDDNDAPIGAKDKKDGDFVKFKSNENVPNMSALYQQSKLTKNKNNALIAEFKAQNQKDLEIVNNLKHILELQQSLLNQLMH